MSAKVDKWLSSPSPKADKKSLVSDNRVGLKRANPFQDTEVSERIADEKTSLASRQSPFRTPPSLPYCPDKVISSNWFHSNAFLYFFFLFPLWFWTKTSPLQMESD